MSNAGETALSPAEESAITTRDAMLVIWSDALAGKPWPKEHAAPSVRALYEQTLARRASPASERAEPVAQPVRDALAWLEQFYRREGEGSLEQFERIAETYYRETGWLRPGKDMSMASGRSMEEQQARWDEWIAAGMVRVRSALASPAPSPAAPAVDERPASLSVVLNMLRETTGGNEAKIPTPACWDLARYVADLEAARRAAALPVEPVRMLTEEESDYCECNTYANTADAIQRKFMEVNAGKTIPKEAK